MEALRKLETVQRVLSFMGSRGLSSGHGGGSDRFLAHFLLFLVQPSYSVSTAKKLLLVSELLSKVTVDILQELQNLVIIEDDQDIYDEAFPQPIMTSERHAEKLEVPILPDVPVIGFDAMQRANSTLEDFCRSYLMFHHMDANNPQSIFKFLPVLSFTESYIYQLDTSNEYSLHLVPEKSASTERLGHLSRLSSDANIVEEKIGALPHETSSPDLFDPLFGVLQCQGLLSDRLRIELKSGTEYWFLERKLCQALSRNEKISVEDVMKAIHLKSFDYRVLNLLMYQLTGQQVNELHMEFLSVSEFLIEISDDLYDYEDDVLNNTFNILRMFVAFYGASVAPKMLAKCIAEAEEKYESLSKKLDPDLSVSYWRRCEEATREGGKTSGHVYGTWNVPPVIVDEELFRSQRLNEDASAIK